MSGPFAGAAIWIFVVISYLLGMDLGGGTAIVILIALGAVLIASAAIESLKISASGLEVKTRPSTTPPSRIFPNIPKFNLLKILCWASVVLTAILLVWWTLLPPAPMIWSEGYGNSKQIYDPAHITTRVSVLLIWGLITAVPAGFILVYTAILERVTASRTAATKRTKVE